MPQWVDCGLNLTNGAFRDKVPEILHQSREANVRRWVLIGTSIDETRAAVQLSEQHAGCIVTAGIHPHDAAKAPENFITQLRELAGHPSVRAIGECGLDFNRNYSPPDIQRSVFRQQLELAAELSMPVYLHERDALADQLSILREYEKDIPAILTHCFTGDRSAVEQYLELGCYVGITGWVCDERRGQDLQSAVPLIPDNKLLLETDAPYLMPRNIRPRPKFRHNIPAHIPYIGQMLAELREQPLETVANTTTENALRFFGGWSESGKELSK